MAITEISVSKIYVLATEPTNKVKDRFWFDTTNNLLKRCDGTSWKPISVSSDDVVVLSSGNKISLTNYLNTQIAALAEGIDSKQDKLLYYSEVSGDAPSATISVKNIKLNGKVTEGTGTNASGDFSHAEGSGTKASGNYSHAEGSGTTASSDSSHAEGSSTTASGWYSHAEGGYTTASGENSHAEGQGTIASGDFSHAEGAETTASGICSHAEGSGTTASKSYQHVQGKYNIEDTGNKYADIIGNGTSSSKRSNAATVSWNGISWSQTDVRAGGTNQDNAIHSLSNKQNKLETYKERQGASSVNTTISSLTDEDGMYTGDIIISTTGAVSSPGNITLSTGTTGGGGASGSITLTTGDESDSSATGAASLVLDKVSNGGNITLKAGEDYNPGNITLKSAHGNLVLDVREIKGLAVDTTISSFSTDSHIPTSKAVYDATVALSESKQDKLTFYYEDTSSNQEASIQNADSFSIKDAAKGLILNNTNSGITIENSIFNAGQAVISLVNNTWKDSSDAILFSVDGDNIKLSDVFLIPEIKNKQNSTDTALNTTNKTIVGAINEIKSLVIGNTLPTPITDVKTITTTLENLITDTQYANKPGTILINPAITNVGTILVGEGITDLNKAFPIYTDQPVTIAFKNINDFKVAGNIAGDKFNYIISFGYINTNIVSDNLKITTTNGVYEITPEGDVESMTLKLSKIS